MMAFAEDAVCNVRPRAQAHTKLEPAPKKIRPARQPHCRGHPVPRTADEGGKQGASKVVLDVVPTTRSAPMPGLTTSCIRLEVG